MKKLSLKLTALLLCLCMILLTGCMPIDLTRLLQGELTPEELYYRYAPSVVEVTAEAAGLTATGTGFFCDENGTVITNYHVIETCAKVYITLINGRTYEVTEVLAYDMDKDIAILATDCEGSVPLQFRTTPVATGEKVYAIGSSLGLTSSLSSGIISCASRQFYQDILIQTTAPISPGNSGGPLFDRYGNVIGITSSCMVDGQNLNFAIPIAEALALRTDYPTTLKKMFTRTSFTGNSVKTMDNWSIQYFGKEDSKSGEDQFAIFFQLRDSSGNQAKTGGSASITIINDLDQTVYQSVINFSGEDIYTVSNRRGDYDFTAIFFDMDDVNPGDAFSGTIRFTVSGADFVFEPCFVYISYLPVLY